MRSFGIGLATTCVLAIAPLGPMPPVMAQPQEAVMEAGAPDVLAQVPLTPDIVNRFLESWPGVSALITELDRDYEPGDPDVVMDELLYLAESADAVARLEGRIKTAGWAGFRDWFLTAQSIMLARQWIIDPPNSDDMDAAEAEIRAMQGIAEDVRAELLANLADARSQIDGLRPSRDNLDAVRMHLDRLDAVLASR